MAIQSLITIVTLMTILTPLLAEGRPPANAELPVYEVEAQEEPRHGGSDRRPGLAAQDTVEYGGTYWAPDSLRWEALRDSVWTFDTGIGSSINGGANVNKPIGYHQRMEGWYGVDFTLENTPYFRRSSTCAIAGSFSAWAGVTSAEALALCFATAQGYGNGWSMTFAKTFNLASVGTVNLNWKYAVDSEPGFDYAYVRVDTTGTGAQPPIQLASYDGLASGNGASSLVPGVRMRSTPGPFRVLFVAESDGGYSDEDGAYPTLCGLAAFDDIVLSGAVTDLTDFESGSNGWSQVIATTGVGDFTNIELLGDLPAPASFCPCAMSDSVLVFFDTNLVHPLDQDNLAASPWIDLRRGGDVGRSGKVVQFDSYTWLTLANYVFETLLMRIYPYVCPGSGQVVTSDWVAFGGTFFFPNLPVGCTPPGARRAREVSTTITPGVEQAQIGLGIVNFCRTSPFGPLCTGVNNETPWYDNISLGVYGPSDSPIVSTTTFDRFQDNFAADGTLNPASPGRLDQNRIKGASTPATGSILGDTLCARGDGGNTEVRLVFKVRPGPFTNLAALNAMAARWTYEPALNGRYGTDGNPGTWPNWYSARMDTAEQGGVPAMSPFTWMSTFHEADPGFAGTDRTVDPNDPGRLANDMLPDHLFTPGSRIDYFTTARYRPPDPRNPSGMTWWTDPDTTGAGFREVEILPSSMAADTSWNCVLYVDHHDDRNQDDQYYEGLGLTAALGGGGANAEGTRYDRFDNQTPSSGQLSFGRPLRSKYGCSQIQVFAYQAIAWHSATLTSGCLTVEDAAILGPWLTINVNNPRRFWGSGEGLAQSMQSAGGLARSFMNNTLGVLLNCTGIRLAGCGTAAIDTTYCLPTAAVAGSHFASTILPRARGNGCPNLLSFDLLTANAAVATARGQLNYVKSGGPRPSASVTNQNGATPAWRSVLDGISVGRLRTNPGYYASGCDDIGASVGRATDILNWFGAATICRIPTALVDVPADPIEAPRPTVATLGPAWPNPMNQSAVISWTQGSAGGHARLEIFDVTGRLVRRLVDGVVEPGPRTVAWDGRSADGSRATAGMYFYRLTARDRSEARKLLVVE